MSASLRGRLALGLSFSVLVFGALQWLAATTVVERLLYERMDARLAQQSQQVLSALSPGPDGGLALEAGRLGSEYQRPFSGQYFLVRIGPEAEQRAIGSRSLWDAPLSMPPAARGEQVLSTAPGPMNQRLRVLTAGYEKAGTLLSVSVAEDTAPLHQALRHLSLLLAALVALLVLAALAVQHWVVRRSLRPVGQLQAQLEALQQGERRLLDARVPSELEGLVAQLNSALGQLLKRSERSRQALGNLSHALKNRLATLVQAAEAPELSAHPALQRRLLDSAEQARQSIERELRRARLMGGAHPARRTPVGRVLEDLVPTLEALHAAKAPRITLNVPPALHLAMDQEDLLELLGNLLDNACAWCRQQVLVSIGTGADVQIAIEDDGPGAPPDLLASLPERGRRADESRPGYGLGLAIVRDLAESYGGRLGLTASRTLGGLRVSVHLPATLGSSGPRHER